MQAPSQEGPQRSRIQEHAPFHQPQGIYSALPSLPPPHSYGETAFEASLEQQDYASVGTSFDWSAAGPQECGWQGQQRGYSALPAQSQPDFELSYGKTETVFEAPREQQQCASGGTSFDTVESADGGAPMASRHVAELSPSLHRHPEGWDAALMRSLEADPLEVHGGGMISAGVDGGGMNDAWVNGAGVNGAGMHASPPHPLPPIHTTPALPCLLPHWFPLPPPPPLRQRP
ncbi:unnamed protein product [Closterium sp. NIES-54]